jgi:hypothetical protein
MPTLYLRDVPEEVHERIQALAREERRSLSAQALTLLEEALAEREFRQRGLAALKEMEEHSKDYPRRPDDVDSVFLLREDRER